MMSKKLTDGEKMVWAAAFVAALKERQSDECRPPEIHHPKNKGRYIQWLNETNSSAMEFASSTVQEMREALPMFREHYEECDCLTITEAVLS